MSVMSQEVEGKILTAFVDAALAAGYRLTVSLEGGYDCEEEDCLVGSTDRAKILEAAIAGESCHVFLHEAEGDLLSPATEANERAQFNIAMVGRALDEAKCLNDCGWVLFVWGNEGWDCISDYVDSPLMEGLLAEAKKISDHYAD